MLPVKRVHTGLLALLMVAISVLIAPVALADGAGSERQQIENLRGELQRLSETDQSGVASEDIARAQAWLEEAEQFLQQRSHQAAEYRLRRADHTVDLVRALIQVGNIEASVQQQEERYKERQAEIERLQKEIEELEARKAERERQLQEVRQR